MVHPKENPPAVQSPETLEKDSAEVRKIIYQKRVALLPYTIVVDKHDEEMLRQFKEEIDQIIGNNITAIENGDPELTLILGEKPSVHDHLLLAIGTFILNRKSRWSDLDAVKKILRGGTRNIGEFSREGVMDTCIDTAVLSHLLAKMYGIHGEIKTYPLNQYHHYWQEKSEEDDSIVDTFWCGTRRGFVKNGAGHDKAIDEYVASLTPKQRAGFNRYNPLDQLKSWVLKKL